MRCFRWGRNVHPCEKWNGKKKAKSHNRTEVNGCTADGMVTFLMGEWTWRNNFTCRWVWVKWVQEQYAMVCARTWLRSTAKTKVLWYHIVHPPPPNPTLNHVWTPASKPMKKPRRKQETNQGMFGNESIYRNTVFTYAVFYILWAHKRIYAKGLNTDVFLTSCRLLSRQIRPVYFMGRNWLGPSVGEVLVACSGRDRKYQNENKKLFCSCWLSSTPNPAIAMSSCCCKHFVGSLLFMFKQRSNTTIGCWTARASPLSVIGFLLLLSVLVQQRACLR